MHCGIYTQLLTQPQDATQKFQKEKKGLVGKLYIYNRNIKKKGVGEREINERTKHLQKN